MKTLILGMGRSGQAAAKLLKKKGVEIICADNQPRAGVVSDQEKIAFDRLILSPGIDPKHPLVLEARRRGVPVLGEFELGLQNLNQPAVGITGTNGKTTTTALVAHLCGGVAVGNIGHPLCDYLLDPNLDETLIIELSSFQLETAQSPRLDAGLILDITPDHLDRYESFEDYVRAKCRLRFCLKKGAPLFVHPNVKKRFEKYFEGLETLAYDDPAAALCDFLGKKERDAKAFAGLEHRLEKVAEFNGVTFYNDSKATNVEAVLYALKTLKQPLVLIVGGRDKGADFSRWQKPFEERARHVIAYGEAAGDIAKALGDSVEICPLFDDALTRAMILAKEGDAVALSPGCASFDQFAHFEERGHAFKRRIEDEQKRYHNHRGSN